MNVEDSYEGAVRRLQRLEMAGIAMEPPQSAGVDEAAVDGSADRMRELEELAMLACEDNERLKQQFGAALQELDDARRDIDGTRAEIERAQHELGEARREIEQLRGYVASLEQTLAHAQQAPASAPRQAFATTAEPVAPAPQEAFAPAPQEASAPAPQAAFAPAPQAAFAPAPQEAFAPAPQEASAPAAFASARSRFAASPFATEALPEEDYGYPPKSSGKGARYFFVVATAGAAIAALCVVRPWDRPHAAAIAVEQPSPPPVVTAPPPAAKVEPTVPKAVPTVAKLAPAIPKAAPVAVAPRPTKTRSERRHAKHHATKKHGSAKAQPIVPGASDDPLGGTNL